MNFILEGNLKQTVLYTCSTIMNFILEGKLCFTETKRLCRITLQSFKLDRGLIRSSPRFGLSTPYRFTKEQCWTVPPCSYLHGRPAFGPSCTEFVYPECWHFDNDASSKINHVLTEHGGLLLDLPLAVHLRFFLLDK